MQTEAPELVCKCCPASHMCNQHPQHVRQVAGGALDDVQPYDVGMPWPCLLMLAAADALRKPNSVRVLLAAVPDLVLPLLTAIPVNAVLVHMSVPVSVSPLIQQPQPTLAVPGHCHQLRLCSTAAAACTSSSTRGPLQPTHTPPDRCGRPAGSF
jgi:hypothetical protein